MSQHRVFVDSIDNFVTGCFITVCGRLNLTCCKLAYSLNIVKHKFNVISDFKTVQFSLGSTKHL